MFTSTQPPILEEVLTDPALSDAMSTCFDLERRYYLAMAAQTEAKISVLSACDEAASIAKHIDQHDPTCSMRASAEVNRRLGEMYSAKADALELEADHGCAVERLQRLQRDRAAVEALTFVSSLRVTVRRSDLGGMGSGGLFGGLLDGDNGQGIARGFIDAVRRSQSGWGDDVSGDGHFAGAPGFGWPEG